MHCIQLVLEFFVKVVDYLGEIGRQRLVETSKWELELIVVNHLGERLHYLVKLSASLLCSEVLHEII